MSYPDYYGDNNTEQSDSITEAQQKDLAVSFLDLFTLPMQIKGLEALDKESAHAIVMVIINNIQVTSELIEVADEAIPLVNSIISRRNSTLLSLTNAIESAISRQHIARVIVLLLAAVGSNVPISTIQAVIADVIAQRQIEAIALVKAQLDAIEKRRLEDQRDRFGGGTLGV